MASKQAPCLVGVPVVKLELSGSTLRKIYKNNRMIKRNLKTGIKTKVTSNHLLWKDFSAVLHYVLGLSQSPYVG